MKKTDYIAIQAPMVTDLKLSGNNLIIFALIHGFCKDGNHKFNGSLEYISEWTNLSKTTIIATLKMLVKSGLLNKEENIINNVKFCSYTTNYEENIDSGKESKPLFKKYETCGKESLIGGKESLHNNIKDNIDIKEDKDKSLSKKEDDEFIEEVYKMYPTKCPKRNTSLGKSSKDKERIKKLMKLYSKEDIIRVVKNEIDSKYGKEWMSNFSTFLNNFPDPQCLFEQEEKVSDAKENNNLILGGVEYR